MFFIAYTFKGQVHVFAGRVEIVSHLSCRTSAILNYFCPLLLYTGFIIGTNKTIPFSFYYHIHISRQFLSIVIVRKIKKKVFLFSTNRCCEYRKELSRRTPKIYYKKIISVLHLNICLFWPMAYHICAGSYSTKYYLLFLIHVIHNYP